MDIKVVVDASVWVSRFARNETHNIVSNRWMTNFIAANGYFIEPSFLKIEIAASISRRTKDSLSSRYILNTLAQIPGLSIVPTDDMLIQSAVDIASDLQLRAGDAIYTALAYREGLPLVSWDKEQLDRASQIIPTYSPDTYPF